MPAWPTLQLPLLADLAEQLRFAPRSAVVKDIERTLETITLIEPQTDYPADWVAFRVTGYRPEATGLESLPGKRLLPQLARLVERLSAQSRLTRADVTPLGDAVGQAVLCRRWNVSRKSLERYRSRGLVAVRVLSERGKSELSFPESTNRVFETRNRALLDRARAFSRVGDTDKAKLRARAERLLKNTTVSRSRAAAHLARRIGRSPGAVRRALPPATRRGRRPRQTARSQAHLLQRWESGIGAGDLARQLKKTRPAIIRTITIARAQRLELWDPSTRFPHDTDARPQTLANIETAFPRAAELVLPTPEPDLESLLLAMAVREAPDRSFERELIAAHHALLRLAWAQRRTADGLDTAETALRWVAKVRAALIHPYRALIVESLDGQVASAAALRTEPPLMFSALVRGIESAASAIEGFTPGDAPKRGIGGGLAAPISLAVARALSEWVRLHERELLLVSTRPVHRALRTPGKIAPWIDAASPWLPALLPTFVRSLPAGVGPRHAALLTARFGLGSARPHTILELAHASRITRIRAAADVHAALRAAQT